jgi:hypothetical protein
VRSDLWGPQEGKPVRRPTQTDHFFTGSQTMRQAPGVPMPVLVDDLAARRLQGIELQGQGLIVRGDAGKADFVHSWNYAQGLLRDPALFGSKTYRRGLDRAKGVLVRDEYVVSLFGVMKVLRQTRTVSSRTPNASAIWLLVQPDRVSTIARARSASPRSRERLRAISARLCSSVAVTGDLPAMIPISDLIKRRNHSPHPLASPSTPA